MSGLPGRQHMRVLSEHRFKSLEETKSLDHHLWKCLPSKLRVAQRLSERKHQNPSFYQKHPNVSWSKPWSSIAMKWRLRSLYLLKIKHSLNTAKDQSLWTRRRLIQCNIQMKCWEKLVFITIILKRKSAIRLDKILLGISFFLKEKGSAF